MRMRGAVVPAAICAILHIACGTSSTEKPRSSTESFAPSDEGAARVLDWDGVPVFADIHASQSSSHDRGGPEPSIIDPDNKDFNSFISVCGDRPLPWLATVDDTTCNEGIDGFVIASDDAGPGVVSRLFIGAGTFSGTTLGDLHTGFTQETIRIYVDDLSKPAYEGPLTDLENGANAPFVPPLTTNNRGALVSYVPISYRSKLRIVLDDLRSPATVYYHQVDLRSANETTPFDVGSLARVLEKGVTRLESNAKGTLGTSVWKGDESTLAPGEAVTVFDHAGAGTLKRLRLTLDAEALDHVTLRITWDSQSKPAVDAPLGALFASHPTPTTFTTFPMSVEVDDARATLTLSLPMPFSKSARIVLSNDDTQSYDVEARFDGVEGVPSGKWGYLHATYNHRAAPDLGERYEVVNVEGRGRYVGTVLAMLGQENPTTSLKDPFNFLEGDDLSVADGTPVTMGTGVEEYFDGGWYFLNGPFSAPFSAVVSVGPRAPGVPGQATAVRWSLLADAIDFQHSFNLSFEYGANAPATAIDYSSVAFYYAE